MNRLYFIALFCCPVVLFSQSNLKPLNAYLIPGMGTDHRVFNDYHFDTTLINATPIKWADWKNSNSLGDYAQALVYQIDTTAPFVLVGVSMGGMLAMEMSRIIQPEAIILISSARSSRHLPTKSKIGKHLPAYCLLTDKMLQKIAAKKRFFKDIKSNSHKYLYQAMLIGTGADFLKWQFQAITRWAFEPDGSEPFIFHIHGSKDKILPLKKKMPADVIIEGGGHKMVVNRVGELTGLIERFVKEGMK